MPILNVRYALACRVRPNKTSWDDYDKLKHIGHSESDIGMPGPSPRGISGVLLQKQFPKFAMLQNRRYPNPPSGADRQSFVPDADFDVPLRVGLSLLNGTARVHLRG